MIKFQCLSNSQTFQYRENKKNKKNISCNTNEIAVISESLVVCIVENISISIYIHRIANFRYRLKPNIKPSSCNLMLYLHASQFAWEYLVYLWNKTLKISCFTVFDKDFMVCRVPQVFSTVKRKRNMNILFIVTRQKSLHSPKLNMVFIRLSFCKSVSRIQGTSILHILTWSKLAISRVCQSNRQLYHSNM